MATILTRSKFINQAGIISLDSTLFIEEFYRIFEELETESLSQLTEKNQLDLENSVRAFANYSPEILEKAKQFYETYFFLIQELNCVLDPVKLINKLKFGLIRLNNLKQAISSTFIINKESLLEYLEQYELKLENRLRAIETEQKYLNTTTPNDSIKIESSSQSNCLVLDLQKIPSPLIGMNNLLNYQLKQLTSLNETTITKINELAKEHNLNQLVIKTNETPNEYELKDFFVQINNDRDLVKSLLDKDVLSEDDDEELEGIIAEISLNLVYRLAWDGFLELRLHIF